MEIKAELQKASFCQGVASISSTVLHAVTGHQLVDDHFETVEKSGLKWVFLCILKTLARPLYALLGKDPYSYVKVNSVAASVLKYCELNKQYIDKGLAVEIDSIIFKPLNEKTKGKYDAQINEAMKKIQQFVADNLTAAKVEEAAKKKAYEETKSKIAAETKKKLAEIEAKAKAEIEKLKAQFAESEAEEKAANEALQLQNKAQVKKNIIDAMLKKYHVKDPVKDADAYAKAQAEADQLFKALETSG